MSFYRRPRTSLDKTQPNNAMSKSVIEHTRSIAERAKQESEVLDFAIAACVGALFSKTNEDVLNIEEEHIYVDSNPNTMDEAIIQTIEYDEDGTLIYTDNKNDEDSDLTDLLFNTRIELAEKLADLLES